MGSGQAHKGDILNGSRAERVPRGSPARATTRPVAGVQRAPAPGEHKSVRGMMVRWR